MSDIEIKPSKGKLNQRTKASKTAFQDAIKRLGKDLDGAFRLANRLDGKK